MIPRPWMAWAAAVALLLSLLGIQTVRLADERAAHAKTVENHAVALEQASEKARKTETALRSDIDIIQAAAAEKEARAKEAIDRLVDDVRVGNRRLSIRASCPSGTGIRPGAASGGGAGPQRAELDPEDAAALVGIARDGDAAIRERNTCIAAYEAVRERLNAAAAPSPAGN